MAKAWLLDPDGNSQCVGLNLSGDDRRVTADLQNIRCWNLVVFELARK